MRAFAAISLLVGLVAANYDEPSTVVLTSTELKTITSCAGGCGEHTLVPTVTPSPVAPSSVLVPETCVPTTVTVTVTVPAPPASPPTDIPAPPPSAPSVVVPPFPTASSVKPSVVVPTGGVYPPTTPTPSPPAFTGAASNVNAGLFVAGAGAFAAFFL